MLLAAASAKFSTHFEEKTGKHVQIFYSWFTFNITKCPRPFKVWVLDLPAVSVPVGGELAWQDLRNQRATGTKAEDCLAKIVQQTCSGLCPLLSTLVSSKLETYPIPETWETTSAQNIPLFARSMWQQARLHLACVTLAQETSGSTSAFLIFWVWKPFQFYHKNRNPTRLPMTACTRQACRSCTARTFASECICNLDLKAAEYETVQKRNELTNRYNSPADKSTSYISYYHLLASCLLALAIMRNPTCGSVSYL